MTINVSRFVEDVLYEADRPTALVVELGVAQPRHAIVAVEDVELIEPDVDLIELRAQTPLE